MTENIKFLFTVVLGLPIGLILTAAICAATSLLWFIFLPWKLFDYIFKKNSSSLQTFEEFIFACYGLGAICTLTPLMALGDDTID